MPIEVPARAYALADGVDAAAVLAFLGDRLDVVAEPPVSVAATVFDTADRRVRDAGAELRLEPGGPGRSDGRGDGRIGTSGGGRGGARLVLRERPGSPPVAAEVPRSRRYLLGDLPTGALRDRLRDVVEMRALLPLVRLTSETQAVRVRNRDEKTVVRLAITSTTALELPAPATGSTPIARLGSDVVAGTATAGPVELAARVEVAGVLGYDRARARVEALLGDDLGLTEVDRGPADEAIAALGGDPGGLRTKVRLGLRPGQRADAAAVAVLSDLADMVEANLPGTIDDLDTEFLHDLRVAVRRSRSVLRELRRAFRPVPLAEQREALKGIQAVTGPTRDLDVQLLDWDTLAGRLPADRAAALRPVHDLVARHRATAFRKLRRHLAGDEHDRVWKAYRAFLADAPNLPAAGEAPDAAQPIARVAGRRIRRVYARMVDMGNAIDGTSPAESLHELRKRGKELRYLLELFGGLWPAETVRLMVKRLKGLQDVLGTHQDREVQADSLRALAPELTGVPGGAEALLALGVLVERLESEQHEARGSFAERFAVFAAEDQRAVVDRTFRAAP